MAYIRAGLHVKEGSGGFDQEDNNYVGAANEKKGGGKKNG